MFVHWYRRLRHRKTRPAARRRGRFRPRFEALECRLTPSNHTWTGQNFAFADWDETDNWDSHEGPPAGDPEAVLVFPSDAGFHESQDYDAGVFPLNAIFFSSGTGYLISAGPGASVSISDYIRMNSSGTNTISLDLELLYTNGTNHAFDVEDPDGTLLISGMISGSPEHGNALVKGGPGTLKLANDSNSWGDTVISQGTLSLDADGALPAGRPLGIVGLTGAALALNGHSATVSEFQGGGTVHLGSGGNLHLVPSAELPASTSYAAIDGIGNLFVASGVTQELAGDSTFSGQTSVQGTLIVTGSLSPVAPVSVDAAGTLRGSGSIGPVTVDGILAPGGHAEGEDATGILHTGAVTFHSVSTFRARLNGGVAGTGYDQLAANGAVDLSAGPQLDVSLGYAPPSGDSYTILTATGGITGTFASQPNNSMLQINGRSYRITYTSTSVVLTNVQFLPPVVSPVGFPGPVSQAVGDFDGDGIPDLVVVSGITTEGLVSFLKGQGDGSFAAPVTFSIGGQLTGVAAAQLRDNAPLDLVVSVLGDGLRVLLGNGDGTFGAPQSYLQGRDVSAFALGRFRGPDQPLDLAATVRGDNHVNILLGNGDGTFGDPTPFDLTDTRPVSIAVGDVNGDGNVDIVVSHTYVPSTVDVLLGNGDGTFQPSRRLTGVGSGQFGTALADLTGDGKLDLVIANDGGYVTVLLGNGDGTFQSPHYFLVGPSVSDVQVADFDQDGIPDIVAQDSNGIAVLYGNGDGTFRSPVQYDIAGSQRQMQVADFNGDGYPDVSVLLFGGSVDVFVNVGSGSMGPARDVGNGTAASHFPSPLAAVPAVVPERSGGSLPVSADDGEDLLSDDFTMYDTDCALTSWLQVGNCWAATDDYFARAGNLTTGNGVPLLDATTVTGNGGGNTMNGNGDLALIYSDGNDNITGFDPNSIIVPISP